MKWFKVRAGHYYCPRIKAVVRREAQKTWRGNVGEWWCVAGTLAQAQAYCEKQSLPAPKAKPKPRPPGARAATTLRPDEVAYFDQLMSTLMRNGRVDVNTGDARLRSLYRKAKSMRARVRRQEKEQSA